MTGFCAVLQHRKRKPTFKVCHHILLFLFLQILPIVSVPAHAILHKKPTYQFQIEFITEDYIQMYKKLQLNTSAFTI
jgi:hypothetical protein